MDAQIFDVFVLGSGPAGLTAAIYTSRADLKTIVFSGENPGGQLTTTTEVENFPGFPEGIQGTHLMEQARKQAQRFGTKFVDESVIEIHGSAQDKFTLRVESGDEYHARCVIIATGASAKWLGLESEQRLRGKGVSACATCDAFFFRGKNVAVVGGGDVSMEESLFLTKFCPKVYVIVRKSKDGLRASKIMQEEAFANEKIEFLFNSEVKEVLGENSVEGLLIENNITEEQKEMTDVQGLFVAIGHHPNTKFLDGFIDLVKFGYVDVHDNTKTSKEGVFVAGDVADYKYRQAITAAGYGCMAALDAEKFLAQKGV
jgi:thioredoxin reductase (NADPH)